MSHDFVLSMLSKKAIYSPTFCETLSLSAGRPRSLRPAPTRHHFMRGAQKNTVFGPICCWEGHEHKSSRSARSLEGRRRRQERRKIIHPLTSYAVSKLAARLTLAQHTNPMIRRRVKKCKPYQQDGSWTPETSSPLQMPPDQTFFLYSSWAFLCIDTELG